MNQFNRTRNVPGCPVCIMPKPKGLILCWDCHRNLKAQHHGEYGAAANALLQRVEYMLECAGVSAEP